MRDVCEHVRVWYFPYLTAKRPDRDSPRWSQQRNRGSMPELDTSFRGGRATLPLQTDYSSMSGSVFDLLSYTDVDTGQREEFHFLLARVSVVLYCYSCIIQLLFLYALLYPIEDTDS